MSGNRRPVTAAAVILTAATLSLHAQQGRSAGSAPPNGADLRTGRSA
jgi:hypothetical protein